MRKYFVFAVLCLALTFLFPLRAWAVREGALAVQDVTASPGEEVAIVISLSQNPGLISLRVSATFDASALSLVSADDAGLLPGFVTPSPALQSPYVLYWKNSFATQNYTAVGELVTIRFRVAPDAVGVIPVTVSVMDSYNASFQKNAIAGATAKVSVTESKTSLVGARLTLSDRILPTLCFDSEFCVDPAFSFTLSGAVTGSFTVADLQDEGEYFTYALPAMGASRFCEEICFSSSFGESRTFSILSICQNGIENNYAGKTEQLTALLMRVYNFGLCAKDVFNPQSSLEGTPYEEGVYRASFDTAHVDDSARQSASGSVVFTGMSLSLGNRLGLSFYAVAPEDCTVKIDGKTLGEAYYEKTQIPIDQQSLYGGANLMITLYRRAPAVTLPFDVTLCDGLEKATVRRVNLPAAALANPDTSQQALMQSVLALCEGINAYINH